MPTSNVKESIDERILRLLGLEDVFDLDYDTYLTLLKEAMVKGRMPKTTIPIEEIEILTDEYKRVKGKKNKGRFEVKKKKISSTSFNVGKVKGLISGSKEKKALPSAVSKSPISKSLDNNISAITDAVISISETLKQQKKTADDASSYDRRKAEQDKRSAAENKLEKRFEGLKKIAEKIIAPVKSILDKIINFLVNVLLGRVVIKLLDWFGDPKNASKVKSIIRFIGDWWPALLGAYVLFGTTFGKFVRGTVGMLGRFIFQIGKVAIPSLLKFVARHPLGAAATALFMTGAAAELVPGLTGKKEEETKKAPGSTKDKIQQLQQQKANLNIFEKLQGKGSEIDEQLSLLQTGKTKGYGFSGGGFNGFVSGEKGVDKVPAMLSDGEFVMSRGAVQKYGVDTLEGMNAAGGGTNQPKLISGVPHAYGGGLIGGSGGGYSGAGDLAKLKENLNRYLRGKGGGPNFDIGNPGTWVPGGGGGSYSGGSKGPSLNVDDYIPSKYRDDYNKAKEMAGSGYNKAKEIAGTGYNKAKEVVGGIQKKLIDAGYLNEKGQLSGAAKNQTTNFLSDLLPTLPGLNQLNKATTSQYLKSIGISKENAKYGDQSAQAMITGKSGIESAHNIGQMQLNKMSKESKQVYMKILKERMSSGTLKSGDVINPYGAVKKNDPRYREQGSVRFYVDPKTGKGYLLDTYGFDPGKVDLGGSGSAAQKQYEGQVKSFQDPKRKMKMGPLDIPLGKIAKKLDLKPMMDATEGGGLPQFVLALRNKVMGYDAFKEASKKDPKRFKTKAQIDELNELGDLKKLAAKPITDAQKKLMDEKSRKAQIAKSKPVAKPVKPPTKPQAKVVYGPPVPSRLKSKKRGASKSKVPNFTAGAPGMRSKQETLGLMR